MKILIMRKGRITAGLIYKFLLFIKPTTCYDEIIGYVNEVWGK